MPAAKAEGVVIASVAGLIVIENGLDACLDALSVTSTVKLNVPVLEGVPLSTPAPDNASPPGNVPEANQV